MWDSSFKISYININCATSQSERENGGAWAQLGIPTVKIKEKG
jgi:hypothetical protein